MNPAGAGMNPTGGGANPTGGGANPTGAGANPAGGGQKGVQHRHLVNMVETNNLAWTNLKRPEISGPFSEGKAIFIS